MRETFFKPKKVIPYQFEQFEQNNHDYNDMMNSEQNYDELNDRESDFYQTNSSLNRPFSSK